MRLIFTDPPRFFRIFLDPLLWWSLASILLLFLWWQFQ